MNQLKKNPVLKPRYSFCLAVALLLAFIPSAGAFQIADIRIEGLQRVTAGTVFGAIPVNVGDELTRSSQRQIVRALFENGSFDDVSVGRDGNVLVIIVKERPSIDSINIEGNKAIKTEPLTEGLADSGLAAGEILKKATLEHIRTDLEGQYISQGKYGASIVANIDELPRNRVAINIDITEGDSAGIVHINIVGNTVYADNTLTDLFEIKRPGLFSFFNNDNAYSREKLNSDIESLESWYLDRGYLNFNVESTQVSISPDRKNVYVTINVTEGEMFTVGEVDVAGELHDVPDEAVRGMIMVAEGQTYSRGLMTASEERIEGALGNSGYTFGSATGEPTPDPEQENVVNVKFFVDAGQRAYVRRISFRGNTVTQDEVLRREMRQLEGGWASTSQIEGSKVRLDRLGYFKEVNVETPQVAGTEDQIDVEYTVEEQPSGSISASLGYASYTGLILGLSYQEANVLGTGNSINVGINRSDFQTSYNFSWFDPYFTVDGVSRGYSIFFRKSDFGRFNVARFSTDSFGGAVNFGYPISEISRFNFSVGYEHTNVKRGIYPALEIGTFLDSEGSSFDIFSITAAYQMSALNRGVLPTRGRRQFISFEMTFPGSELEYFRVSYNGQIFLPLTRLFTLHLKTDLGYGESFGDTDRYPFYKHFFAGGFGSVRGYEPNSLGPRATPSANDPFAFSEPNPIGGNVLISGTAEIIFPLPFVKDQRSMKSVVYIDAGNVFNSNCPRVAPFCQSPEDGELRYSAGLAFTMITGFAPISASYSVLINPKTGDEDERFQFEMGKTF